MFITILLNMRSFYNNCEYRMRTRTFSVHFSFTYLARFRAFNFNYYHEPTCLLNLKNLIQCYMISLLHKLLNQDFLLVLVYFYNFCKANLLLLHYIILKKKLLQENFYQEYHLLH